MGEPINPEAWIWYHEVIGNKRCPIVDTWWQTETGMILITPLPGAIATKPGSCTRPFPGIVPEVVDKQGNPVGTNQGDFLVIRATGTDAYNPYIQQLCPNENSVATLIISNRTAASDPFVISTIQNAEAKYSSAGITAALTISE